MAHLENVARELRVRFDSRYLPPIDDPDRLARALAALEEAERAGDFLLAERQADGGIECREP